MNRDRFIDVTSKNDFYKQMLEHPVKSIEHFYNIKLKWHQKILVWMSHIKAKKKEKRYNKMLKEFMK